jgi:two-component system sensor histidine kinase AlgZ
MNTIAALTRSRPEVAEEAIQDLSDLFRASLGQSHEFTSLDEELKLARRYLHIEALRLGERLEVEWQVDAVPPEVRVPPLILQPLLENAIYHGIEPLPEGGTIRVNGDVEDGQVVIEIINPVTDGTTHRNHVGNRIARENIHQRLELAFGRKAGLETEERDGYHRVTIRFPEERVA